MTAATSAPSRRPTPRPVFDAPAVVRHADTRHHIWGDSQTGLVSDRVYVSSAALHALEYQLAPGGEFRTSATNPTAFAADVLYAVLEGTLVLADPEHGEVRRVDAGSFVLLRRDTWHHGFNPSRQSVRVLEFFAPPPSRGTASDYASSQPPLTVSSYHDNRWVHRWPDAGPEREAASRLHVLGEADLLWSFAATQPSHLLGTVVDTEHLLVQRGHVEPGHVEEFRPVPAESLLVVTAGRLWVDARDAGGGFTVACLAAGDAAYLPAGCEARTIVRDGDPASYLQGTGRPVPEGWAP